MKTQMMFTARQGHVQATLGNGNVLVAGGSGFDLDVGTSAEIYHPPSDAFAMADQVLYSGVACITDLMVKEGLINLDFADVRAVMREMGKAMMGTPPLERDAP